jgi:hypothetical protein
MVNMKTMLRIMTETGPQVFCANMVSTRVSGYTLTYAETSFIQGFTLSFT